MKNKIALIALPVLGVLFLLCAGFYGSCKAWPHFGFSLVASSIFFISGLLESQYLRFKRQLDKLEELIRMNKTEK